MMPIRHFLTTGVAFATAGMIAAVPAIAPPLQPRDVAVVKATEAQVNLAASLTLTDLINVYFGVTPEGAFDPVEPLPAVDPGAAGTFGFSGLIYQLLHKQQGTYEPGAELVDGFFQTGLSEVLRQWLVAANPDFAAGVAFLNTFFNEAGAANPAMFGVPGVIYLRLLAAGAAGDLTPDQMQVISDLFEGGFSQVVETQLLSRTTDPDQIEFIEDFFEGGITQNVWTSLTAATTDPDQLTVINDFFTGGVTQNVRTSLLAATTDPNQLADIAAFFPDAYTGYAGGISENVRIRLLAATTDPDQQAFINEYFDNGITGAIRFLLVGPAPEPPPEPIMMLKTAVVEETPAPKVEALSTASSLAQDSSPVVQAASAPVAEPAPPAADPTFTAKISESTEGTEEEDATTDVTDGNKVEPIIIEGSGGPKKGTGSWGIFGQIAKNVHDAIAAAGKKPAAPADADADAGDGGADGS